jgi:inhibitor of KinA
MTEVLPFGDQAVLAVLGDQIDVDLNARVHALAEAVSGRDGLGVPVAAYASVLVPFDLERLSMDQAIARVQRAADETHLAKPVDGPLIEIPVRYGSDCGPDLLDVAERTGLSVQRVIELHSGAVYRVYILGFVPGFAYLGTLPDELVLPRRAEPRVRIPAGSVAIAASQTAVYPSETPGGWHLIGRTHVRLWDPLQEPPATLMPGTRVRFVPA